MLIALLASLSLLGWLTLALFNGRFWIPLLDAPAPEPKEWPDVDIIVPARNEADVLPQTLPSLLAQDYPGRWRILLIDDHSTDGTRDIALCLANEGNHSHILSVIAAPDLPQGWSGKVASMQAGVKESTAEYILFTDADIAHPPHSLRRLVARALADKLDLNSLMVKLHCQSLAEKLLIPAFVFFFAMLYPFRRANNPRSRIAAAAGGVMLVKKQALEKCGGLERIKSALIDDCALARAIKDSGGNIRLTLTRDVLSLRPYPTFASIERMIARSAFTQLHYSYLLLLGTVIGLGLLFFAPWLAFLMGEPSAAIIGLAALFSMFVLYIPSVRFYGLSWIWSLTLPLAAAVYMVATLDSAFRYLRGKGGQWKGRAQAS